MRILLLCTMIAAMGVVAPAEATQGLSKSEIKRHARQLRKDEAANWSPAVKALIADGENGIQAIGQQLHRLDPRIASLCILYVGRDAENPAPLLPFVFDLCLESHTEFGSPTFDAARKAMALLHLTIIMADATGNTAQLEKRERADFYSEYRELHAENFLHKCRKEALPMLLERIKDADGPGGASGSSYSRLHLVFASLVMAEDVSDSEVLSLLAESEPKLLIAGLYGAASLAESYPELAEKIAPHLHSADQNIRWRAFEAMTYFESGMLAHHEVFRTAQLDTDPRVRLHSSIALLRLQMAEADCLTTIIELLEARSEMTRWCAVFAAAEFAAAPDGLVDALIDRFDDRMPQVRLAAMKLAHRFDPDLTAIRTDIKDLCDDKDERVSDLAYSILGQRPPARPK